MWKKWIGYSAVGILACTAASVVLEIAFDDLPKVRNVDRIADEKIEHDTGETPRKRSILKQIVAAARMRVEKIHKVGVFNYFFDRCVLWGAMFWSAGYGLINGYKQGYSDGVFEGPTALLQDIRTYAPQEFKAVIKKMIDSGIEKTRTGSVIYNGFFRDRQEGAELNWQKELETRYKGV